MWVQFLKTYAGPLGLFVKGLRYDVPFQTRNELKKQDPDCLKNLNGPYEGLKIFESPQDKQFRPGKKGVPYRAK